MGSTWGATRMMMHRAASLMHMRTLTTAVISVLVLCAKLNEAAGEKVGSNIDQLTPWNFEEVVGGDKHVLVLFHAPWCGACKKYMPDFEETAEQLRAVSTLSIRRADVTEFEYEELRGRLNVSKVPALKLFKRRSTTPITMTPREPLAMQFTVKDELGLRVPNKCMFGDSDAADVGESNWNATVMDPKYSVLVQFYAPWCPHCERFKSTYNIIARKAMQIDGVKVVRVNGDKDKPLMLKYGVKMLPTLMLFNKLNKTGTKMELPEAKEYLEMVDKVLAVLKKPESTEEMESDATALLIKIEQAEKDGRRVDALRSLEVARTTFNVTRVWRVAILPLYTKVRDAEAMSIKEKGYKLAEQGMWEKSVNMLAEIPKSFHDTAVAQSEAFKNLFHNAKEMHIKTKK